MATALAANPPPVEVGTTPHDVVHTHDRLKVLHYRPPEGAKPAPVPLILAYALVNKPYIMDLQPDRSVVRSLQAAGLDVYLIDWGTPGEGDKYLTVSDYLETYIDGVVDAVCDRSGCEAVSVLGYCMGGSFSTMYAALHPEKVRNLVVMAAPLDFTTRSGLLDMWADPAYFDVDRIVDTLGNVSGEFLNSAFLLLDPLRNMHMKYLGLVQNIDDREFVENFFRMEKWIHDGIPVAGETFREFIKYGYQRNLLVKGEWPMNGGRIDLKRISMPLATITADADTLVPAESTLPLHGLVSTRDREKFTLHTGHIGLSVGRGAHRDMWPKVGRWILDRSERRK